MTTATVLEGKTPTDVTFCTRLQVFFGILGAAGAIGLYLSLYSAQDVVRFGSVLGDALLLGGAIGFLAGRFWNAVFWAGIGAVFGCLVVTHADLYHWTAAYAWPLVGGVVGATAAICRDRKLVQRMACPTAVALGLVAIYSYSFFGFRPDLGADLACAALGGALMGLGVELVERFERYTSVPRYLLAIGLVGAGIAGHWLGVHYIPGL